MTRHIALKSGCRTETPGLTVNRLCGSGFQSAIEGAKDIILKECNIVLAGGTENMTQVHASALFIPNAFSCSSRCSPQAPYALRDARFGTKLGLNLNLEDTLWQGLSDSHCNLPMGMTAENLAEKYNVSREDAEKFSLQSQLRTAEGSLSFERSVS